VNTNLAIFVLVVAASLLLPLLIFRQPLAGVLICMALDAADQTIFELFTTVDLSAYQSWDKAFDVYYLALAYVATLRNWVSRDAFAVARALFYVRLIGVVCFELTGARHRELLFLFPNTFEFFFVLYELVRIRWNPARFDLRAWAWAAAAIWVLVKLPQEYWIHVAQRDLTDTLAEHPAASAAVLGAAAAALALAARAVRPRLPAPDHEPVLAAGPLPPGMDGLDDRLAHRLRGGRVFDLALLEKIVLITLVSVLFVEILPGVRATPLQVGLGVGIVVTVNAFLFLFTARRGWGFESALASFAALALFNVAFVYGAHALQRRERAFDVVTGLFLIGLLTLIVSTYTRYRPVLATRLGERA
jgi:hypothetical protein